MGSFTALLAVLCAVCAAGPFTRAAVIAGRVDVDPSGGSLAEKPVARVAAETPAAELCATSGNRGDWTVTRHALKDQPGSVPFRQADGVLMASLNERLPLAARGGVEVGGAVTCPTAGAPADGGSWVAGFSAEGDGIEANVDFAVAWFPFAAGWTGAHVDKDGSTLLASGNLPAGTTLTVVRGGSRDGEVRLTLGGVDALDDGMLFAVAAANGDNVTAVGPLPDGSGWHLRIADEANDFKQEQLCAFSFVYLPYRLAGLIGGWVGEDGRVLAGAGSFGVRHSGPGQYEIAMPERPGNTGILLVEVAKMNGDGVEDNAIAWSYDPAANRGAGAYVVETYDQPGFQNQDVRFYFAFIPYDNQLDPKGLRVDDPADAPAGANAATWADCMLGYQAMEPETAPRTDRFSPFFSGPLTKASPVASVDLAVQGLTHLWLLADPLDTSADDVAAWGDAGFLLADGTVVPLRGLTPQFASVGVGTLEMRPVELAGRRCAAGLVAPAPSALCYAVPATALRFRALAGLDGSAGPLATVRLSVVDRHDRRSPWNSAVRPALDRRFPALMRRLREHLEQPRLSDPDFSVLLPRLRDAATDMAASLGAVATDLPPPGNDLASTLRRYESCCRWLDDIARVDAGVWVAAPALAQIMDYPATSLLRLRTKLEHVKATQPANATPAAARLAQLAACEASRGEILRGAIRGDLAALQALPELSTRLLPIAEWADRARGWTTFRNDVERSALSRETLTWPLRPLWVHTPLAPPAPAWPPPRADNPAVKHALSPTLTYDHAYHVVAAAGRVFYGDNAGDAIVCLDASNGAQLWRFPTEGPVRLAPVLWADRVYAGSDDGWLYCLQAADGALVWRYRPAPADAQLPGNQRLISACPVRGGIAVDQGTVYFGAGVFPSAGTFLCALDALTGQERWKEPTSCGPQGFLLLSPSRVFVPTGRTPFQAFDRRTGKALNRLGQSNSWGKDLPGGTCALIVNRTIATGPGEGGVIHLFDEKSTEGLFTTEGLQVVVDGLTAYVLMRSQVVALQRTDYLSTAKPQRLWEGPCRAARTLIKVGDHLVIGTDDGIEVMAASDGQAVGRITLPGAAVDGLAWHDGRLLASATDGRIACLVAAATAPAEPLLTAPPRREMSPPPGPTAAARELLRLLGRSRGLALLAGADSLDLALALASQSELQCVIAEPDPARSTALRQALSERGQLGARLSVHHVEAAHLPYGPYLFNLVVATPADPIRPSEWGRVLRPCGGLLLAATSADLAAATASLPGERVTPAPETGYPLAFRRGEVPGAGRWTHGYADAGNTACSDDALPFGPFDVLWFGRPGPQYMYERHVKAAAPLCNNGLLFVNGMGYLAGVDAYNGTVLWERHEPASGRMAMLKDCGNLATTDDRLYVAAGGHCLVLAGLTGQTQAELPVPGNPTEPARWGYLAVVGDRLLGSRTRPEAVMQPGAKADYDAVWYQNQPVVTSLQLFALARQSGALAWEYRPQGVVLNPTLTVLDGRLCFVESSSPETHAHPTGKIALAELFRNTPQLVALDLASGRECWRVPVDLSAFQHAIYLSGRDGALLLSGSRHDTVNGRKLIQYQLRGIDLANGRELWRNDNTPSRAEILDGGHGEQTQHPVIVGDTIYGPGFARRLRDGSAYAGWLWNKSPQCAPLSASRHCAFSRQGGLPTAAEFASGKEQRLTLVSRPGCWLNTLPAGGIVAIPEASSGCTCGYPVQTSLALCPRTLKQP
jgi:outer membrane protein assembly factor BamB